ncbi:hypothetical protein HY732_03235 [Candidatus Uhrbacteria bacterium]|nr:hypothetical protein [Candidatus Uhrbacteria bacterium]
MTDTTEQPKQPSTEEGELSVERAPVPTRAEQEAIAQKKDAAADALQSGRADTVAEYGKAETAVRTLQTQRAFDGKAPEGMGRGRIAKTLDAIGGTLRKALGTAGMVAAMSGGFELSKFTTLTAGAAPLEKSPTAAESVDSKAGASVQECRRLFSEAGSGGGEQRGKEALRKLVEIARKDPAAFSQFLEQSYKPADPESGRTLSTDWGISKADIGRAVSDSNKTFSLRNTANLLGPLLDRDGDVKLIFSSPSEVVVKQYASQALLDKPHSDNGVVVRRDVMFHAQLSGQDYGLRGVMTYDDKGKPQSFLVDAQSQNARPFDTHSIHNPFDEQISLLSQEFQNEFARYQQGEMGARTLGEYAKPGRELVEQLRGMAELEKRGLTDEAQLAAREIAKDVQRIESGRIAARGEGEGKGFFDFSKFPERVQQELARETTDVDDVKEIIATRGGMALRQLGRDIDREVKNMFSESNK